jgi:hypothetical protein
VTGRECTSLTAALAAVYVPPASTTPMIAGEDLYQQSVALDWLEGDFKTKQGQAVLREAIVLLRRCVDEHLHFNAYHDLIEAISHVKWEDDEELRVVMREERDCNASFLHGLFLMFCLYDEGAATEAVQRALTGGHGYAGYHLSCGLPDTDARYYELLDRAVALEIADALRAKADRILNGRVAGTPYDAFVLYERAQQRGCWYDKELINKLREQRPYYICPWTPQWQPAINHRLVPPAVRAAVREWLLVALHLGIKSKDIRLLICSLIITRNGWSGPDLEEEKLELEAAMEEDGATCVVVSKFIPLASSSDENDE